MSKKIKKDRVIAFRLSQSEFTKFEEKLAVSEMSKSEFFREVFLNANVNLTVKGAPSKELKSLVFIYNKSSNNLNQIAYKANLAHQMGHISERLYIKILNRLVNIEDLMLVGVNNAN